jgi:hypothetical protein
VKLDPVRLKVSIIATSGVHSSASRTSAIFHVAASDAVAAFQCRLDRGAFSPCTGATHQIYNSLRAGRHVFTVRAVDPAGDVSTAQRTWVVGPSAAKVKASLRRQLVPRGKAGGLHAVLARGGYSFAFRAIGAGKASVSWYFLPPGARIVLPGSKHHHQHHPSPVLVATGHVTFTRAGTRRLTIKLTSAGRQLLHGPISLVAEGSFTPSAEQAVILLAPFRLH